MTATYTTRTQFPGGDYDVFRPTFTGNGIDLDGRTGSVKAAINGGVMQHAPNDLEATRRLPVIG